MCCEAEEMVEYYERALLLDLVGLHSPQSDAARRLWNAYDRCASK